MIEQKIMKIMESIEYGFKDENNNNILITNPKKWDEDFYKFYFLLSPYELLQTKCGLCWDQVELERKLFEENNIRVKTYFICTYDDDKLPSHTFLTYEKNNKHYWFEHSWGIYKGIHEYNTKKDLLLDIKNKFINNNVASKDAYTFIYQYQKPNYHISCQEFYEYCEKQTLIKINEPLYFYHLINKGSNINNGILSLKYMYDHKLYSLFDKYAEKYKDRITSKWNIKKYKSKNFLSREDIMDALNIFRGKNGISYIYFFKYPPYEELGPKISEILKYKDIYRININDEEVQKRIKDIFWGFNNSNSDNKLLDKHYYQTVTKQEYFENYDDNLKLNFSTLNHISIAFINDYCPIEFLKKIN